VNPYFIQFIELIIKDKIVEISEIGRGVNNKVYRIDTSEQSFALKTKDRGLYDFYDAESFALSNLNGVIAPKMHHYHTGNLEWDKFILMELIEGQSPGTFDTVHLDKLIHTVGAVHASIKTKQSNQSFSDRILNYLNEKCISSIPELESNPFAKIELLTTYCKNIKDKANKIPLENHQSEVLIHGDLGKNNLIESSSEYYRIVDWELSRYAIPEVEFAGILWTYMSDQNSIESMLKKMPQFNTEMLLLLTLARGLDVSVWMTKWLKSLPPADPDYKTALKDLDFFWKKINHLAELTL
jgi:aminoglycoside phosphotransferase (APT) family kinase protein